MAQLTGVQRKRKELLAALDEYQALVVFARMYNSDVRRERDTALRFLPAMTKKELEQNIRLVRQQIAELANTLKPTQPLDYYVAYLKRTPLTKNSQLFLPKWYLKYLFRGYSEAFPKSHQLPEHTRIAIDVQGITKPGQLGEIRIIEAALYEDMAALFNRAWELAPLVKSLDVAKVLIKESAAVRRGCVLASFYMVEAYLNSIAFDHLVQHQDKLSPNELNLMTEWDHAKHRERLVSFRDKLLHYPRIILGLTHPPLQENNSPEVMALLDEAKAFRDAIVHANPRPDLLTGELRKEERFWEIGSPTPIFRASPYDVLPKKIEDPTRWIAIVDTSIAVIEQIEAVIHGGTDRLWWLKHRSVDGLFDESVFE